jgi:hypothetical protein
MRFTTMASILIAVLASIVDAGIVITPIDGDQVVDSVAGDCFFGVSTPQGCGPLRKTAAQVQVEQAAGLAAEPAANA